MDSYAVSKKLNTLFQSKQLSISEYQINQYEKITNTHANWHRYHLSKHALFL